mgnify:CR=1 FL=1
MSLPLSLSLSLSLTHSHMILYVQSWKEGNLPEPHDNERLDSERNEPDEPEQSARPLERVPGGQREQPRDVLVLDP